MTPAGTQLDLWSSAPSISRAPPRDARPPDSEPGRDGSSWRDRRDDGIRRAQDHAEADCPGWTEQAAEYLGRYAVHTAQGQPWLLEDAREASLRSVPTPSNPKAWGKAVQVAARRGLIVRAGYAPARSSNGSPKCLWRAA